MNRLDLYTDEERELIRLACEQDEKAKFLFDAFMQDDVIDFAYDGVTRKVRMASIIIRPAPWPSLEEWEIEVSMIPVDDPPA